MLPMGLIGVGIMTEQHSTKMSAAKQHAVLKHGVGTAQRQDGKAMKKRGTKQHRDETAHS